MPFAQTFANPTREGDPCWVPSGRRIQVRPIAFPSLINWPPHSDTYVPWLLFIFEWPSVQLMFTNYWNPSSKTTGNFVNEIWVITILVKCNLSLTAFTAGYSLVFMDEFVYNLLTEERVCDIIMPRLVKRQVLEENSDIGPRKSRLLAAMEGKSDESDNKSNGSRDSSISRSTQSRRTSSRSHSRTPSDAGSRYVSRSPSRSISRSPSLSQGTSDRPMDVDKEYHND